MCVCVRVCVCVLQDVADMPVAGLKTPPLIAVWLLAKNADCILCTPLLQGCHMTWNILVLRLAVVDFLNSRGSFWSLAFF